MTRVASQLTFCSPDQILRQAVVEIDDNQIISALFSLETQRVESAHTLFYDGILSKGIVSIKEQRSSNVLSKLVENYQYIDLSSILFTDEILPSGRPLLLDFGTGEPTEVNRLLQLYYPLLAPFSIFDLIAATVYYPALLLGLQCEVKQGVTSDLLLWQGADLLNKKLTSSTSIFEISRF